MFMFTVRYIHVHVGICYYLEMIISVIKRYTN